jgi:hypothetical protein
VRQQPAEQSFNRALLGQPRPHPVSYILACALHPQRFRLEPNGDLVMERWPVIDAPAKANERFRNKGSARMFFGLERWTAAGRFTDPAPSPAYNSHARLNDVFVHQKSVAVPLRKPMDAKLDHDETIVALVRFTFTNAGSAPAKAQLPLRYSSDSARSRNPRDAIRGSEDDYMVPISPLEPLSVSDARVLGTFG